MLAPGAHLRLETFDAVAQPTHRRMAQRPALARLHRNMPFDPPSALGPALDAAGSVTVSVGWLLVFGGTAHAG